MRVSSLEFQGSSPDCCFASFAPGHLQFHHLLVPPAFTFSVLLSLFVQSPRTHLSLLALLPLTSKSYLQELLGLRAESCCLSPKNTRVIELQIYIPIYIWLTDVLAYKDIEYYCISAKGCTWNRTFYYIGYLPGIFFFSL